MILERITLILMLAAAVSASVASAADNSQPDEVKQLQGIGIVGNKEAPKSLFIVPWQTTEHEQNTSLSGNFTDSDMQPLDRKSFQQQLRLYELGKSGWHTITPDRP
jgi:hypothetical protein